MGAQVGLGGLVDGETRQHPMAHSSGFWSDTARPSATTLLDSSAPEPTGRIPKVRPPHGPASARRCSALRRCGIGNRLTVSMTIWNNCAINSLGLKLGLPGHDRAEGGTRTHTPF